jgi:hypothetical protein
MPETSSEQPVAGSGIPPYTAYPPVLIGMPETWTVENVLSGNNLVQSSNSPISFFHLLGGLKTTKREGWKRHGIE